MFPFDLLSRRYKYLFSGLLTLVLLALILAFSWHPRSGRSGLNPIHGIPFPQGEFHFLRGFSADGKTLFSWHIDRTKYRERDLQPNSFGISIWDVRSRKLRARLEGAYGWQAFSPDGALMAASQKLEDGTHVAKVWDVWTGEVRLDLGPLRGGFAGDFLGNGNTFVQFVPCESSKSNWIDDYYRHRFDSGAGNVAGEFKFWDLATGKQLQSIKIGDAISRIEFSGKANTAVFVTDKGDVLLHPLAAKPRKLPRRLSETERFSPLRFSPDGKLLAIGAILWDIETLSVSRTRGIAETASISAFSSDSRYCFVLCDDVMQIHDLGRNQLKAAFPFYQINYLIGGWGDEGFPTALHLQPSPGGYTFACCSPDGKIFVAEDQDRPIRFMGDRNTRFVRIWDVVSHTELARLKEWFQPFLSPDGKLLAGTRSNSIVFFEVPAPIQVDNL